MAFCKKCGAYIPMGETACPACGYDPEAEAREAQAAKEREEAARKQAEAEERAARERAEARAREEQARREAEERRRREEAESFAARERQREEEERRRAEQRKRWEQDPRNHSYTSGATQSQYTSQRTGASGAAQGQYASERTGQTWVPPWSQGQTREQSRAQDYSAMRDMARDSVDNQKLSILSYLGPLVFIPLFLRRDDDFARFHSNQGLVLFIFNALVSALAASTGLGFIAGCFSLYCIVKGISNVLKGKKEPLPLIGKITLFK